MAHAHDKIGIACTLACAAHCIASAALVLAGSSILAGSWFSGLHEWLLPLSLMMVAMGIAPAWWRHRCPRVALAVAAGLGLWGLALIGGGHGVGIIVLEIAGAAGLAIAHWLNMKAARRTPVKRCTAG